MMFAHLFDCLSYLSMSSTVTVYPKPSLAMDSLTRRKCFGETRISTLRFREGTWKKSNFKERNIYWKSSFNAKCHAVQLSILSAKFGIFLKDTCALYKQLLVLYFMMLLTIDPKTILIKTCWLVGYGLTSHSAIFQLYGDGTVVQFPNFDLLPGTQRDGHLVVFSVPSLPRHGYRDVRRRL